MHEALNLVGDVGGTHARFALCTTAGELSHIRVVPSASFDGIEPAIRHYLHSVGDPPIRDAVIGMANPVTGDQVQMTNLPWTFSIDATRTALDFWRLHIINDFTALALSLPHLPPGELAQAGGQTGVAGKPLGVVGPGTGLGMSTLVPLRGGRWMPLPGEGGHASFAPVTETEVALWREARTQFGHVSAERLLSGSGLKFIYQTGCRLAGVPAAEYSPAEISARAIDSTCPQCRDALDIFCGILGTVASNIALTCGTRGGLYIGGGIVPKLGEYFFSSPFRARFEDKGRFSGYLAAIPAFVVTSPYPGLIGAGAYLNDRNADKGNAT